MVDIDDTPNSELINTFVGMSLEILCNAPGKLTWKAYNSDLPSNFEVVESMADGMYSSLLRISNVSYEDAGAYYCTATEEKSLLVNCK